MAFTSITANKPVIHQVNAAAAQVGLKDTPQPIQIEGLNQLTNARFIRSFASYAHLIQWLSHSLDAVALDIQYVRAVSTF